MDIRFSQYMSSNNGFSMPLKSFQIFSNVVVANSDLEREIKHHNFTNTLGTNISHLKNRKNIYACIIC